MKILMGFYPAEDMGGIINHAEQLTAGLQELGHTVDLRLFMPRKDLPRNGVAGGTATKSPYTGLYFDQRKGHSWPNSHIIPYLGAQAVFRAVEIIRGYDMVIWETPIPTKRKENRGNNYWPYLYDHYVPQVAISHDGNFPAGYPWLSVVSRHLAGVACVHPCAYANMEQLDVPRAFIPNPQHITYPDLSEEAFNSRVKGFLSVQTFKGWKRVPELVAAVPYMGGVIKMLAGKGIDYYYLTSKDKCKWPGIWDAALANGMDYMDVITNEQRDVALRHVICLIDPSWSRKYAAVGSHFNRVVVDAILMGAVPVMRPLGLGTGSDFVDGVNCLTIPQGATPQEYGERVAEICKMNYSDYIAIMTEAVKLLPQFDRTQVASQFVNLALHGSSTTGTLSQLVAQGGQTAMKEFFHE